MVNKRKYIYIGGFKMSVKPSLQEKLAKLRSVFVSQFPERQRQLKQHLEALQSQIGSTEQFKSLQTLHLTLHSLKGTAASFGFNDLANLSEQGETLAQKALDKQEILAYIKQLAQVVEHLQVELSKPSQQVSLTTDTQGNFTETLVQESTGASFGKLPLVYLCDDEPDQLSYLAEQLQSFGFRVQHFNTTESLRSAVLEQEPDAIIMDVQFPNGQTAGTEELLNLTKLTSKLIPSIVLSGHDDFNSRLSAVRAGAEAYFIKPARSLDLATSLDNLIAEPSEENLRILIVDDEPVAANYHSEILASAGMRTYTINQPNEILDALRKFNPDLVLVDIYMPGCDGIEMSRLIRQIPEYYSLPLVFLSSESKRDKQFYAMQVGVEGFITKPVIPEELITNVTLSAKRMRALRGLMVKDSLTGLYNHTTTSELKTAALQQAKRDSESLVMAMLDLDYFKRVNDTYGHMAGDKVLIALARLLKKNLRTSDVIGRFGGEEFVVLLKNTSLSEAEITLNNLREDFAKLVFVSGEHQFNVTFSAGLSAFPQCTTAVQLRLAADAALYKAKELGRNQIVISKG